MQLVVRATAGVHRPGYAILTPIRPGYIGTGTLMLTFWVHLHDGWRPCRRRR
jgi:hypothetical protein